MNSCAHDVALYLATQGIGSFGATSGWSINVNAEPAEPATTVTIYDYPGDEPDTDEMDEFRPSFQVRVRADFPTAYEKQEDIRNLLLAMPPIEMETSLFSLIVLISDIFSLGRDQEGRHWVVASYRARRTSKE